MMRVQRRMAFRVICAYNTVSYVASAMLVRVPPVDLLATKYSTLYYRVREARAQGIVVTKQAFLATMAGANESLLTEWKARLENPSLPL